MKLFYLSVSISAIKIVKKEYSTQKLKVFIEQMDTEQWIKNRQI